MKEIHSLSLSYHPGPDGISASIIKCGGPDIPTLLLNIFTLSLETSTVPLQWKHSIIAPRYKSGSRFEKENARFEFVDTIVVGLSLLLSLHAS